ncbi:hypothetical protein [Paenibacillus sp. y28]|uniref:hypothetical protein n=1 Tax=Paenibacillus sp. y28 TaxID=3129110 RepID=UPI0030183188
MSRFYWRFAGAVLLLAFGIAFGVELASRGTERIHGPLPAAAGSTGALDARSGGAQAAAVRTAAGEQAGAGRTKAAEQGKAKAADSKSDAASSARPRVTEDPLINRITNKIGELLQMAAYHGVRLVVSWLEGLL